MVLYHSTTLRVRVAGQAPGGRAKAAYDIIVDDAGQIIGRDFRNWHRRDDRSNWRIGRLAGVKLTLSNNRRIFAVGPNQTTAR